MYANGSNDDAELVVEVVPDRAVSFRIVPYGDEDVGEEVVAGGP